MRKQIFCLVCGMAFLGTAAAAGELSVKIANGRATVIAKDVPVRQILAEWAKVGETKVVGAERQPGGPVTLELVDVPEKEALDLLLRTAAGYIAAPPHHGDQQAARRHRQHGPSTLRQAGGAAHHPASAG